MMDDLQGRPRLRLWLRAGEGQLLTLGLLLGLLHLPISLETSISLTNHGSLIRTLVLLLYPLALALTGLGAALYHRLPALAATAGQRAAGLALLAFLLTSLRASFLVGDAGALVRAGALYLLSLGCWFLLVGAGVAGGLAAAKGAGEGRVGRAWALHLCGLVAGYALSEAVFSRAGVNGVVLCAGVALLVWPRRAVGLLAALLLFAGATDLDGRLEQQRVLGFLETGESLGTRRSSPSQIDALMAAESETMRAPEHLGWSRYGQVRVVSMAGYDDRFMMLYNLRRQYDLHPGGDRSAAPGGGWAETRRAIYEALPADGALMFIGTGSGKGLEHLPFALHPEIYAVEREPGAMRLFTELRPALNDGRYLEVTPVTADGRAAVERHPGLLDVIAIESSRYQLDHALMPATAPFHLHTGEALATYLEKLAPEGLLILEFSRTAEADRRSYPEQVTAWLRAHEIPHQVLSTGRSESLHVLACAEEGCVERWLARIDLTAAPKASLGWENDGHPPHTLRDDRPFMIWTSMGRRGKRSLLGVAGGMAGLAAAAGLMMAWRWRRGAGWNAAPYFLVVGAGHTALQFHAFYAWRAYYNDELMTIIRLIVAFLIYGAIGSALASRIPKAWLGPPRLLGVGGLLLLHFLALRGLPFLESEAALRELYGLLACAPGGLLMGLFVPLGLEAAPGRRLGGHLAADALGTMAGYALLYLVYLPLGARWYGAMAGALYLIAAALFRR